MRNNEQIKSVFEHPNMEELQEQLFGSFETTKIVLPSLVKPCILGQTREQLSSSGMLDTLTMTKCSQNPNVCFYTTKTEYGPNVAQSNNQSNLSTQKNFVMVNDKLHLIGYPYSIKLCGNVFHDEIMSSFRFFEANEGTVLRVFKIGEVWYTTTNKKPDAFKGKWASKKNTFGIHLANELVRKFKNADDGERVEGEEDDQNFEDQELARNYVNRIWEQSLNPNKKYFFLLKPCEEERVVCYPSVCRLLNIGLLNEENVLTLDEDVQLTNGTQTVTVAKPTERSFKSANEFDCELEKLNPLEVPGFIAIATKTQEGTDIESDICNAFHVKILSHQYWGLYALRNNVPSLRFRLLQLSYFGHHRKDFLPYNKFVVLYKKEIEHSIKIFNYVDHHIALDLHAKYMARVRTTTFGGAGAGHLHDSSLKQEITPPIQNVLNIIHNEFRVEKSKNPTRKIITTVAKIQKILRFIKPETLNKLIKEYERCAKRASTIEAV